MRRYLRSSGVEMETSALVGSLTESARLTTLAHVPGEADVDTDLFPRDEYPSVLGALTESWLPTVRASVPGVLASEVLPGKAD